MKNRAGAIPIRKMARAAVFSAVLCAIAPFSITIGPIPLSFATLVIYLAAGSLGWKYGALSVALYVLLGAVGLPVFTGFEGGFQKIADVTGGFIIGYIPCALAAGIISEAFSGAGGKLRIGAYVLGMAAGTVLLYTIGTGWFIIQTGVSMPAAILVCVVPFLIGDAVKIVLSCVLAPRLRSALTRGLLNN